MNEERKWGARECPVCHEQNSHPWRQRNDESYLRCPGCKTAFSSRTVVRTGSTYDAYYEYAKTWDRTRILYELGLRRARYNWQLRRIERTVRPGRLLEVGAGPGYFCAIANDRGWETTLVDLNPTARQIGEEVFGLKYVDLNELSPGRFDVICLFHVLEHMIDPVSFLSKVRELARPGALAVIHVPHQEPLSFLVRNALNRVVGRVGADVTCLYGDEHLTGFTPASLATAVERAGWNPRKIKTIAGWSRYYDPCFAADLVRAHAYTRLVKKSIRHCIESIGTIVSRGDWIVGYLESPEASS